MLKNNIKVIYHKNYVNIIQDSPAMYIDVNLSMRTFKNLNKKFKNNFEDLLFFYFFLL